MDRIALEEGRDYGFRLYFRGDGPSLPVRMELELPSRPTTWGDPEQLRNLVISEDGRTAIYTSTVATGKLLEQVWTVADGDPEGEYQIRIFVQDNLVKTFKFRVQRE